MGIPGPWAFVAMGLFFAGMGAAGGSFWFFSRRQGGLWRPIGIGLAGLAVGCFGLGTALPFLIHAGPLFSRPSTTARLEILTPRPGEVIRGDPATVPVEFRVDGGKVVPITSLHLIPNEGHIHLYLDGSLVSMSGLRANVTAQPGPHTLRAEFVAIDHGPFRPRVLATVSFRVRA
jgi:hypothetical protein